MAEKKRADYSESAENLCNPDQVRDLMVERQRLENLVDSCKEELKSDEVYLQLQDHQEALDALTPKIREAIGTFGSFQDIEAGVYGVKYRRISKSYDAEKFAEFYPNFAPAVIIQVVNEAALEGLVKGKLITEEELKNCDVTKEKIGYAFYIR